MNKFYFLMIAVMMTACVGAVNLPAGTITESKTEKPDETPDPKSIVIDDKEPEPKPKEVPEPKPKEVPEPKPKEVPEPKPKEVVAPKPKEMVEPKPKEMVEPEPQEVVIPPNPCLTNPFGNTCGADFHPARESTCANEPNSARCRETVKQVCDAGVLNPYCSGAETYFSAQEAACTDEPNSERCFPTLDRVCGVNAFDTLCQLSNLKMRDLPKAPHNNFGVRSFDANDLPRSSCLLSWRCRVYTPSIINIKPLDRTNTGIVTYEGGFQISYFTRADSWSTITSGFDIIVNFHNNTLIYSGNVISTGRDTLNINGNFTDRGVLTGTVTLVFKSIDGFGKEFIKPSEAPLIGLIGNDRAIGFFASEGENRYGFAGGFRVTPQ